MFSASVFACWTLKMKAVRSSERSLTSTSVMLYGISFQKTVTLQTNTLTFICNKFTFQLQMNANSCRTYYSKHDRYNPVMFHPGKWVQF
jgi:hypothetical protein